MRSFRTGQPSEKEAIHLEGFLEELVAFRNRTLGHGAPLGGEHHRAFGDLFGPAFAELLDRSPFLTARRLVSFDSTRVEEGAWVECAVIEYMGNQPVRRQKPHRVRYGEPVPREKALHLLTEMGDGESSGLLAIDPLLVAHREDVYVLNEARGAPEYISYSTGERHRPSDLGWKQGELFEKILGYRVDETRMSQMGDELASTAEKAASIDLKDGEKRLGDYRIVREVGRGAMGAVFEAFQESLGRRVALKVLPGSFALEPRRLERFRREARATARIHHPSIVPVYEVGESGGTHYYSMEFVDGASLEDLLARARKEAETKGAGRKSSSGSDPAAVAGAVERLASLAEGLEEAHRLGLIHRDVKPSNILVEGAPSVPGLHSMPLAGDGGRCVLVDFGLVHEVEAQTLTRSGEMVGTLGYMSPEQVSKGEVDARADVYSLGVTLYEVLTLRTPFDGKSDHEIHRAILFEEPPPPRRHNPRLHRDLETIVLKCMEKNPERRYASAGALAKDLRRFLRYEPIEARPRSALSRLGNRAWKHRRSLGVTGITAVLLLSVLFFALLSRNEARLRKEAEYGPRVLAALMKIEQADLSQVSWNSWTNTRNVQEAETSILGGLRQVLAEAIAALGDEIESVPERPEAHYHRARAYRVANRDDDALRELAQVTAIDPEFVPALVLEAEIREKRGEEEASAALRERARAAGKGGWKEQWIHAQEALENGLWGDAERAFGEIIALEADGGEAYLGASYLTRLGRGKARLEAKDYLRASDDFAAVEALWPGARQAVLLKGKAYHLLGLKREAQALFEMVHAEAPPALKDDVALAISQIFAWREPETALEWCAKVNLEFLREEARVLILWIAGRSEEAVQAGERAIALNPAYAPSYADLSFALTKRGRFTEAIRYSRKAIELRPKDAFMRIYSLPHTLRNSGRNVEALAAYEETLRLDPTMAVAHTYMANILVDLGELKLAEEHRQRAKDLQPLDLRGLLNRGQFFANQGREEDALAEYDRAIRVDPAFSWAHVDRGEILERRRKLEEAMTEYRTATELFPAAGNGYRQLGRLLEGQGKFDDALAGYAKALEVGDGAGAPNADTHLAAQRLLGKGDVSLASAGLERLVAVLEAALPFEGEYPELLRTLALARSRLGTDIGKTLEPIRAALERKGGKDPALSLVLGEALLRGARPRDALAVLEEAARHHHATAAIAKTARECRKALLPGLATPASVEEALSVRDREVLVPEDAVWRYFPGTREPSEGLHWTAPGFDDGSWKEGKSGFGYGDGDDATVLEDMQLGHSTLYIRRKFTVPDPGRYERLILSLRVDDGAVVYLNGEEAGRTRAGTPGTRLPHDAFGSSGAPEPLVAVEFSIEPSRLVPGENVLAIQGLNNIMNSTDFSLIPGLVGELPRDPARTGKLREALETRSEGEPGSGLLAFLEGLLLLEEGKRTEAAGKLERTARAFPNDPLPHLRVAECLRAAGDAKAAEAALRRAIEGGLGDCREVWDLWAAVSLADLKRSAAEVLADVPKVPEAPPAASGETGPVAVLRWLLEALARGDGIRIHCGGEDHVAKDGRAWSRDRFFRSGFLPGEDVGHPWTFTLGIEKTDDDPLYQSCRWFPRDQIHPPSYRIPLQPGEYQVTLHFAEFTFGRAGSRSFGALLEGREVLTEYEPLGAGLATAEAKTFRTKADDGLLDIEFVPAADNPMVSGIEIQRLR